MRVRVTFCLWACHMPETAARRPARAPPRAWAPVVQSTLCAGSGRETLINHLPIRGPQNQALHVRQEILLCFAATQSCYTISDIKQSTDLSKAQQAPPLVWASVVTLHSLGRCVALPPTDRATNRPCCVLDQHQIALCERKQQ